MRPTRREFLWTMGAAGAAFALHGPQSITWSVDDEEEDAGWAPGIEERLTSVCFTCPARCGLQGRVVDGRLVRLMGNALHPMSRGGICPRGVAGVQKLYHPERLAGPLVREGSRTAGDWRQVQREEAIDLLSERLMDIRAAGRPEALALLAGYCAGTMNDLWNRFLQSFGSPNYVSDAYDDGTDSIMSLMHGISRRPSYDLERADLVISFGAPLFEAWWSPLQAFVSFAGRGSGEGRRPRFVQVDTRFSRTAARSHEWVGIRLGTHAALALGLAYVLIRDELFDADFIAERVSGFEDFDDSEGRRWDGYRSLVMRHFRTEEVSAITGVPVERITALARAFAGGERSLAVCGSDVTLSPNGLLAGMAVHSLNLLMGSVNRPGGVLFGDDPPLAPLGDPVLDETARQGLMRESLRPGPPFGNGDQATRFAESIAGGGSGVEALFLYYADPLSSSPRPNLWREALDQVPLVVSFSPFFDRTARHADLILPDLLPYERWQDAPTPASYPYPVWGLGRPLVEPHDGGTHTGDVLLAVAQRLGGGLAESLPYESFEALLKERARGLFVARRGMTLGDAWEREHHRQMEERGWWLPEHNEFEGFWNELVERGGWTDLFYDDADPGRIAHTPDGRIQLMPEELLTALAAERPRRRVYIDAAPQPLDATDEYPLRLLPYRVSTLASGSLPLERWLAEQPSILPDLQWRPWVEVNPETARSAGLADNAMVWVVSQNARYRARLKVSPGTAPENVCAPYGLRHPDGELANPLQLLDGSMDPLTGLPSWHSTFVRLEPA